MYSFIFSHRQSYRYSRLASVQSVSVPSTRRYQRGQDSEPHIERETIMRVDALRQPDPLPDAEAELISDGASQVCGRAPQILDTHVCLSRPSWTDRTRAARCAKCARCACQACHGSPFCC